MRLPALCGCGAASQNISLSEGTCRDVLEGLTPHSSGPAAGLKVARITFTTLCR